jgi:hypothetical protein
MHVKLRVALTAVCAATLAITGCSSGVAPPSTTASASRAAVYSTKAFAIPLKVEPAKELRGTATTDTPSLVSWTSARSDNDFVRFLVPANVFPAGAVRSTKPPVDYNAYLHSLSAKGVVLTDVTTVAVDGVPGNEFTIQSDKDLPGAIGCVPNVAQDDDNCFGVRADLRLRMVVLNVQGKPLLIWARTDNATPNTALLAEFEQMVGSVTFR